MTRVLVVDDEPQIRRALATNLRARGYDVDLAATGEEALRLAADRHPDVVILDLGLPGIDGIEVVAGLRGWTTVPIIVLSVREAEADKVAALDAGADDYVTKPFGMDELLARLRAAVRRRRAGRGASRSSSTDDFTIDLAAKRVAPRRRRGAPHARPSGAWSRCSCATGASSSPSASCCRRSGGPQYETRDQLPAGLHGRSCAASSSPTPASPATSSPSRAWATASSSPDRSPHRPNRPGMWSPWQPHARPIRRLVRRAGFHRCGISGRAGEKWHHSGVTATPEDIDHAASVLAEGGLVAFPTETGVRPGSRCQRSRGRGPHLRGEGSAHRPSPHRAPARRRRPRPVGRLGAGRGPSAR